MEDAKNKIKIDLLKSWQTLNGEHALNDLLFWIKEENEKTQALLIPTKLSSGTYWYYDEKKSIVTNQNRSFFYLTGLKGIYNNGKKFEQPIIVQNEIGCLGIVAKYINGVIHFLMQAKIEPGNVNNVQISPTIQATESNSKQKHGGRIPFYFKLFHEDIHKYEVVYDGNEPEQCSRFLAKFNRNVIILVKDDDLNVLPNFRWMTIGQIKYFANHENNLVNMDTRTVLSCIPYFDHKNYGSDESEFFFEKLKSYRKFSTFSREMIKLNELSNWQLSDEGMWCKHQFPFRIGYFDITIKGREVTHWTQPLAIAHGQALFGLFAVNTKKDGIKFLIKIKEEVGCENVANFGPSVQLEATEIEEGKFDEIESLFFKCLNDKENCSISVDTILSEEGGRFYHEQNRNVIIVINEDILPKMPNTYFLANYKTLWNLISKYHCLNIQLRDLISLLEVELWEK